MSLDWVQRALRSALGFVPFPATLNLRAEQQEIDAWRRIRAREGILLPPADGGFCAARLYPVKIQVPTGEQSTQTSGAVLVPDVDDYPENKIEIVAAACLKETLGIRDGDRITLEFVR